jgi:hypothetical protein
MLIRAAPSPFTHPAPSASLPDSCNFTKRKQGRGWSMKGVFGRLWKCRTGGGWRMPGLSVYVLGPLLLAPLIKRPGSSQTGEWWSAPGRFQLRQSGVLAWCGSQPLSPPPARGLQVSPRPGRASSPSFATHRGPPEADEPDAATCRGRTGRPWPRWGGVCGSGSRPGQIRQLVRAGKERRHCGWHWGWVGACPRGRVRVAPPPMALGIPKLRASTSRLGLAGCTQVIFSLRDGLPCAPERAPAHCTRFDQRSRTVRRASPP